MYKKQHFNVLLNLVLKPFNLQWNERLGLSYLFNLHYGNIMFNLTKDINEVLLFLGVDPDKYINSNYSMNDFLEFLYECKYTYLPSIFGYEELPSKNLEDFKKDLVKNIKLSIEYNHLPYVFEFNSKFHPYKDPNRFIHKLDKAFNKKGAVIRAAAGLKGYKNKKEKAFIKNKFNGKLMVDWVPELLYSTRFGEIKNAFMAYVEKETNMPFSSYAKTTEGKRIRIDFSDWYYKVYKELDKEFYKLPL